MGIGSRLGANLKEGLRPIVDLVYPPRCPLCGDAIAEQGGLCAGCWGELDVPGEPACKSCNRPMGSDGAKRDTECTPCRLDPPRHSGIHAATLYDDASRKLILTFKHGGKIALSRLLGRLMAARLPDAPQGEEPLLVPVPLHRLRLWERGYNQAALLARELEKRGKGALIVDALVRTKRTPSLGGLGRTEREQALRGAIVARGSRANRIKGRDVILVDDVLTSGATSDACVAALLEAGAASVRIACFARVVSGGGGREPSPHSGQTHSTNETPEVVKTPGAT